MAFTLNAPKVTAGDVAKLVAPAAPSVKLLVVPNKIPLAFTAGNEELMAPFKKAAVCPIPFALLANKGNVYAFEPTATVDILKTNISNHPKKLQNITIINKPLGENDVIIKDKIHKIWSRKCGWQILS